MPKIIILPHFEICPNGEVIDAKPGLSICENLLQNHIDIEHACDQVCACTTCHVIVREGFDTLNQADDLEEDLLGNDDANLLTNKFFAASYSLVDTLYLALSDQSAANDSNRLKISTPTLGHSNPIYITQRVLRI